MSIHFSPRVFAVIAALFLPGVQLRAEEATSVNSANSTSQANQASGAKVAAPYFFIQGDADVESLPLKETKVQATLNGVVASVHVRQVYRNQGRTPINARYIFPGSIHAAMGGMSMTIGQRRLVARIKEKEQAAALFAAAKAAGQSAALLGQKRPNVFSMDVANILPKDEVIIDLDYTEILTANEGVYEFVYPGVVGPRYTDDAPQTPVDAQWLGNPYLHANDPGSTPFDISVDLVAPVPISDLRSESHTLLPKWKGPKSAQVRLATPGPQAGTHDFVLHYRLQGDGVLSGLTRFKFGGENYFLLLAEPPRRVAPSQIPARDYLFILDTSGSMSGFPLDTARNLIMRMIASLGPEDSFNILFFAGGSSVLADAPLAATTQNKAQAAMMLGSLRGGGGTELLPALQRALAMPRGENQSRSIVLMTDGFISAESDAFKLIDQHLGDANLFAFGIGTSVNRYLIEGLAKVGHAESFIVSDEASAEQEAERFRRYISAPVLTGINVRGDQVELYDLEPAAQPDLMAERPLMVLGKYRAAGAAARIELNGTAGDGAHSWSFALDDADEDANLPRLWARKRLERLYVLPDAQGDTREQILGLGLKYSLLTSATSFVAVDETPRTREQATDVTQPLPLPTGVSDAAVGEARPMPEPEWLWLAGWGAILVATRRLRNRALYEGGRHG